MPAGESFVVDKICTVFTDGIRSRGGKGMGHLRAEAGKRPRNIWTQDMMFKKAQPEGVENVLEQE